MERMEDFADVRLPFEMRIDPQGEGAFIGLFGELDQAARDRFSRTVHDLDRQPPARIVVDLSGLSFVDSTGLLLLLTFWKHFSQTGVDTTFEGASEQVLTALQTCGLDQVFPVLGASPHGSRPATSHSAQEWLEPPRSARTPVAGPGIPPHLAPPGRRT
jgi:stage II sporulation protein AA (anti-sigma F factor antagonist)